jgi:transcriptional regulator with XRE-family HTH domain
MWRKDRFEEDVKRVGRSKVAADLFGDKTDTTINSYYGEKANMNPSLATIEKFCRYFDRPIDYYVDLDDETGEHPTDTTYLIQMLDLKDKLIQSKEEQIILLKEKLKSFTQN